MLSKLLMRNRSWLSADYLKRIQKLFADKKYDEILQIKGKNNITKNDMKQKYYSLIKKYHSDNCQHDEEKMKIYEEITKIIIASYHSLDQSLFANRKDTSEDTYVEDQICMELFGKKYNQAKYWMYEKGNQKAKQAFFNRLFKVTGKTTSSERPSSSTGYDFTQKTTSSQTNTKKQSQSNPVLGLAAAGLVLVAGLFWWSSHRRDFLSSPSKSYNSASSDNKNYITYQNKSSTQNVNKQPAKITPQKKQLMIKSILKDHPPSVKYPEQDPHIMRQLTEFSIGPDIHLYEVPPKCYKDKKEEIIKEGIDLKDIFHITRIKPNTAMTLSLEAQRALHNIYVRVKDLVKELETKGKYTPPQVFLRFHGFIMFEIREKPISLRNYRDTDYVSLFDLYFDEYSPIFLKKDHFAQYLVGKDEIQYFGWVYLNNKKCTPVYLKPGQKAAFFHSVKESQVQETFQNIWAGYYQKYADRWREGGNSRQRAGI